MIRNVQTLKTTLILAILVILCLSAVSFYISRNIRKDQTDSVLGVNTLLTEYSDNFTYNTTLDEAGSIIESSSPNWWVNSGGQLWMREGRGRTMQGDATSGSKWQKAYANANPVDTDNGLHPQNIFRLTTQSKWNNARQSVYFRINKTNLSSSPNRNASNGLLLFNRYVDSDNLYYTGIRVDGALIVKKKKNGTYYTMAYKPYITGATYDRTLNPNLLSRYSWIGFRTDTVTESDGTVRIKIYIDRNWNAVWTPALEVVDDGSSYGGAPITEAGHGGIRTDFMDVEFDNYRISQL